MTCTPIARGIKHCNEATWTVDQGAQNDGVLQVWFNSTVLRLTNLDQGAITHAPYGIRNQTGVGKGHFLLDDVVVDNDRLYPRQAGAQLFTKSGWAFVGPGEVDQVRLIDGGSGNTSVKIYDTARINYAEHDLVEHLIVTTNQKLAATERPFQVHNGCYVKLGGTDPQALVRCGATPVFPRVSYDEE